MKNNQKNEEVITGEFTEETEVVDERVISEEEQNAYIAGFEAAKAEQGVKPKFGFGTVKDFAKKHKVAIGVGVLSAIGVGVVVKSNKKPEFIEGSFVEMPEETFEYDSEYKEEVKSEEEA